MFEYEKFYINNNQSLIVGVDEAGRGPLAGPVVCASVMMPLDEENIISGVNDSKKLTQKKREALYEEIIAKAIAYSVEIVNEKIIDEINILEATKLGMVKSINNLNIFPDIVLVDAVNLNHPAKIVSIVKGDELSYSIACASILAKVTRDRLMVELDEKYPNYNFKQHKGYGTKEHINNIKLFGVSEIHRKTFIKKITKQ